MARRLSVSLLLPFAAATVTLPSLPCGTSSQSVTVNGVDRTFLVHTPSAACNASNPSTTASAVVLCLHGWLKDASWACRAMCVPYAEAHGFVAVCPQGGRDSNGHTGWNTHDGSGWGGDDTGFVRAAVGYTQARTAVRDVTYAIGFSMGGGMTYRLMCEASDVIAGFAIASQTGPWGGAEFGYGAASGASWAGGNCTPAVKRPFWAGIGTRDIFYTEAGVRRGWEGYSRAALGCSDEPTLVLERGNSSVTCLRLSNCTGVAPETPNFGTGYAP